MISAEDLTDLIKLEGDYVDHFYLDYNLGKDKKGGVVDKSQPTVGIGHLVAMESAARALAMVVRETGRPASPDDQAAEWKFLKETGNLHNHGAKYFKSLLMKKFGRVLQLPKLEIERLFAHDVAIAYRDARDMFPGFDAFPRSVRLAIIDMSFNLGKPKLGKFVRFGEAVKARDWGRAAAECHRNGVQAERNHWTWLQFLKAAGPDFRWRVSRDLSNVC